MEDNDVTSELPVRRWVLALSYARLHPMSPVPQHAPSKCKCWHVVIKTGRVAIDEYGNRVAPVLAWQELPPTEI